jgi:serine/threonine-protein kinase
MIPLGKNAPAPQAGRLAPGSTLGRYHVLGLLGRGGMGEVYLAEAREGAGKPARVALKVLAGGALAAEGAPRFERERELLARVSHRGVVQSQGPLETDRVLGLTYFPMELVLGKSLADILAEHGTFPAAEAVRVLSGVAAALEATHRCGIVHRDVKPSNVLVDRDGQVRLTDFGLARALDETRFTVPGRALGTPAYMAPEQAAGKDAGPPADLYALGAVGYELLTGRPPFQAENGLALLRLHMDAQPASPRELVPSIPEPLERLVLRLLSKEPAARGASAGAIEAALDALAGTLVTQAEGYGAKVTAAIDRETRFLAAMPEATTEVPARGRRRSFTIMAPVVCVVALVGWRLVAGSPPVPSTKETGRHALVTLDGGRTLAGEIVAMTAEEIAIVGSDGVERAVPRSSLRSIDYEPRGR